MRASNFEIETNIPRPASKEMVFSRGSNFIGQPVSKSVRHRHRCHEKNESLVQFGAKRVGKTDAAKNRNGNNRKEAKSDFLCSGIIAGDRKHGLKDA